MGEAENINNTIKEYNQDIRDINDKSYASKIKKNSRNNINGALVGGGIGILIGVASRQNFYITGAIGLIIGRLFITNLIKK
jgi:F0F1-type ATP synthase assembly protein I